MENSLSRTYYKTYDRVKAGLAARHGQWNNIADELGIARTTIKRIAHGQVEQPDVGVLETLDRFLSKPNGKQKH